MFDVETGPGMASALGYAAVTGGTPIETWRERIQSTTLNEVRNYIARSLNGVNRQALLLLSRPEEQ